MRKQRYILEFVFRTVECGTGPEIIHPNRVFCRTGPLGIGRNCSLIIKSKNISAPNIMSIACGMPNVGSASASPAGNLKFDVATGNDSKFVVNLGRT